MSIGKSVQGPTVAQLRWAYKRLHPFQWDVVTMKPPQEQRRILRDLMKRDRLEFKLHALRRSF